MARYVIFPGTAGSYADTPDTNLLDADTAHLQQSIGDWGTQANIKDVGLSTALTPVFGDSHGIALTVNATTNSVLNVGSGTGAQPAVAAQEYSFGLTAATELAGREVSIRFRWFDAAGATISTTSSVFTAVGQALDTVVSATATSPALTAFVTALVQYQITGGGNLTPDEEFYWDACILAEGSDGTFVPSLRVVGDIDLRAKVAADDWTLGTIQTLVDARTGANGYRLEVSAAGDLTVYAGNGAANRADTSTLFTLTDGNSTSIRATLDVSTGGWVWYENDTQIDTATVASGANTSASLPLRIGSTSVDGNRYDGDVFWAEVRDGIDGPIVAIFDAEDVGL